MNLGASQEASLLNRGGTVFTIENEPKSDQPLGVFASIAVMSLICVVMIFVLGISLHLLCNIFMIGWNVL